MKLSRIVKLIFLHLQHLPMKSKGWRPLLVKWGGVNILNTNKTFIGERVTFDTNFPECITIEEGVRITVGCVILTHFRETNENRYSHGNVIIKKNAYIGCNAVICKPVTIGKNAIIGAGSIVTKDVPANQV